MFSLRSKISIKLLRYFFTNPHAKHYLNELARILEVDSGNLDRKIKSLEKEGVFHSEKKGNQKYYFMNHNYPFLPEIKKIFQAKYGLKEEIFSVLKNIKGLEQVYIFGSYAKGNLEQESDIDLLIIGSHPSRLLKEKLLPLQKKYGREFNIIDLTRNELEKKKKNKDPFIKNLFSGKVIKVI
jgi:predicted nucleotidyltransferase